MKQATFFVVWDENPCALSKFQGIRTRFKVKINWSVLLWNTTDRISY
jgi:hypothetical protein